MQPITRQQLFEQAAKLMRQKFEEVRASVPHAGAKGEEVEHILRKFLNGHLPRRFAAGSGFVLDRNDQVSRQTDVVIYDALNCPVYRVSESAGVFPSDNVAAVIEVKASLDRERLMQAAENIGVAKRLAKTRARPQEGVFVTDTTLGVVFAFESPLTLEKLSEHYAETFKSFPDHIDFVIVLDRGILGLSVHVPGVSGGWSPTILTGFHPSMEGSHVAAATMELGTATLDAFMRYLLGHITFFHHRVDHPGFNWQKMAGTAEAKVRYLTSVTLETDPVERAVKLLRYEEAARRILGS